MYYLLIEFTTTQEVNCQFYDCGEVNGQFLEEIDILKSIYSDELIVDTITCDDNEYKIEYNDRQIPTTIIFYMNSNYPLHQSPRYYLLLLSLLKLNYIIPMRHINMFIINYYYLL